MSLMHQPRRLAIVGAGIMGLAHALAAARRGDQVTVYERDTRALGASVRNFGLGLLLGQPLDERFELAQRSRTIWLELLGAMGLWHKTGGSLTVAQDPAQWAVLQAFQSCAGHTYSTQLIDARALERQGLNGLGALQSPHEIALWSRDVLPALARWLAERHGVRFEFGTQVHGIELPRLHTSRGVREAEQVIVCSGHEFQTLYPEAFAPLSLRRCTLQMLRLADPGLRFAPSLMTGLSALHYPSFTQRRELQAPLAVLREQIAQQDPQLLEQGLHLIVQQGADGSLIVGDSHRYGSDAEPFLCEDTERRLLALATNLLGRPLSVLERWQGVYASGPRPYEILRPADEVLAVCITSGVGMSIGLALAEQTLQKLMP